LHKVWEEQSVILISCSEFCGQWSPRHAAELVSDIDQPAVDYTFLRALQWRL